MKVFRVFSVKMIYNFYIMSVHKIVVATMVLLLSTSGILQADEWPDHEEPCGIGVDGFIGTPSKLSTLFSSPILGISVRWMPFKFLGIGLDYASLGKDYYWFDGQSGEWNGPGPFSDVPTTVSEADWIFYDTRNYFSPCVIAALPLGDLEIHGSLGISVILPVFSDALSYYPEVQEPFDAFLSDFQVFIGYSVKMGVAYRFADIFSVGVDYLFIAESFRQFGAEFYADPFGTIDRNGNLLISAGIRL